MLRSPSSIEKGGTEPAGSAPLNKGSTTASSSGAYSTGSGTIPRKEKLNRTPPYRDGQEEHESAGNMDKRAKTDFYMQWDQERARSEKRIQVGAWESEIEEKRASLGLAKLKELQNDGRGDNLIESEVTLTPQLADDAKDLDLGMERGTVGANVGLIRDTGDEDSDAEDGIGSLVSSINGCIEDIYRATNRYSGSKLSFRRDDQERVQSALNRMYGKVMAWTSKVSEWKGKCLYECMRSSMLEEALKSEKES